MKDVVWLNSSFVPSQWKMSSDWILALCPANERCRLIEFWLCARPSQWRMSLQSNPVSHWLGASLESALKILTLTLRPKYFENCFNMTRGKKKKNHIMAGIVTIFHFLFSWSDIILCMCSANERWGYSVMHSLIGWAHTQDDPWCIVTCPQ